MKEILLTSLGFAFFIVCPRMAGMVHIITKNSDVPLFKTALFGIIISIPLLLLMILIFSKFGIVGALIFCVFTDFSAAFLLKEISFKAGVETFIVALFVILGVKVAPLISNALVKTFPMLGK